MANSDSPTRVKAKVSFSIGTEGVSSEPSSVEKAKEKAELEDRGVAVSLHCAPVVADATEAVSESDQGVEHPKPAVVAADVSSSSAQAVTAAIIRVALEAVAGRLKVEDKCSRITDVMGGISCPALAPSRVENGAAYVRRKTSTACHQAALSAASVTAGRAKVVLDATASAAVGSRVNEQEPTLSAASSTDVGAELVVDATASAAVGVKADEEEPTLSGARSTGVVAELVTDATASVAVGVKADEKATLSVASSTEVRVEVVADATASAAVGVAAAISNVDEATATRSGASRKQ